MAVKCGNTEYTDVNNESTLLRNALPRGLQIVSMFYN